MPSILQSLDSQASRTQQLSEVTPTAPISPEFNAQRHLAREVWQRRDEYVKTQRLRIKIGSWNTGACSGTEKDIQGWFVDGKGISKLHGGLPTGSKTEDEDVEDPADQEKRASKKASTIPVNDSTELPTDSEIDIYVLGLQEIVDINSAAEALRPYNDAGPAKRWKESVAQALPEGYVLIAEQQLLGLLLLLYASPRIAATVSSVSTTSVGTGLMGYMGNKGAVSVRIVLGETTKLVFVNSHLAAGNDKASLERRNWDASQIIQRTRFAPIDHGHGVIDELGDYIGAEDFAFWFGDLNYRLADIPGQDVRRLLLLHTRNEYDKDDTTRHIIDKELNIKEDSNQKDNAEIEDLEPSADPASALTTISSLMTHDELHNQMKSRNAFHEGWQEGPVQFLPTYKYDIGSVGMFDSSEKKRSPSWCDRILYRSQKHYQEWLQQEKEIEKVKKRDVEMKARGLEKENGEDIIFDYDPEADGEDGPDQHAAELDSTSVNSRTYESTNISSAATIDLEYYVSHQRVLSSDHKPLDAIFAIEYNAIDAELRQKVHQEVAKEIDRLENEGRPSVTAIFESSDLHEKSSDGCQFGQLRFFQEKVVLLTVANTSPVPATFEFVNQHGSSIASTWFSLGDHDGSGNRMQRKPLRAITLQPGDSANLEISALVHTIDDLQRFNSGASKPEDILILRVHKGRDHFIPINASWLQSCFGLSINQLIRLGKAGVRHQDLGNGLKEAEISGSAPRELYRLTEAIEETLSTLASIEDAVDIAKSKSSDWPFLSRSAEEVAQDTQALAIREALDTESPFDFSDVGHIKRVEMLGEAIVLFLTYLPSKIVDEAMWTIISTSLVEHTRLKQAIEGEELRNHVLEILSKSPPTSVSFTFMTFMLGKVIIQVAPDAAEAEGGSEVPMTPLSPKTPDALLKRTKSLSLKHNHQTVRRKEIERALVERFIPLIFEADTSDASTKIKRIDFERKKFVLSAFLSGNDVS